MSEAVPRRVADFIAGYIPSIEHLEVLLRLWRSSDRWWTAESVALEMRSSASSARACLEDLSSCRLLDARTAEDVVFRYQPLSEDLDEATRALAGCYERMPVAVTTSIYARRERGIRGFADSFRIRKEGDG